tara:strand:- start:1032 stop:2399 length:1368 start_codon:yes stop_codon:yes gene_type:complete
MLTDQVKNIHIISIGGSVMHDLAITLKKLGNIVTGSDDIIYDPSKSKLKSKGLLPKEFGYFKKNIHNKIDFVITGMHTKKNNVELNEARKKNIPILSYPEYITKLSENKHRIVIAGSHGKTTITSMIMHVLKSNKIKFDYVIGAKAHGFKNNISISNNPIIIIEGDEYLTSPLDKSPKFLKYNHHIALINGIEWDHFNVFKNEKIYVDQFYKLIKMTPKGGEIIYFENDKRIIALLEKYKNENTTLKPFSHEKYSLNKKSAFILDENNKKIKLNVFGKHNMQNIAGAKLVCEQLGIKQKHFYLGIKTYNLPEKRLQKIYDKKIKIFIDFAHSPSKLKATINAVKNQHKEKLLSIYELHSSSSFNFKFLEKYNNSLNDSDYSIIYISNKKLNLFTEKISENKLQKFFNDKNIKLVNSINPLKKIIRSNKYKKYNKLFMSSGNFDDFNIYNFYNESK